MRLLVCITTALLLTAMAAMAEPPQVPKASKPPSASSQNSGTAPQAGMSDDDMRLEGEKRFRTNCGRCHQPPHKFGPRMMASIVRHMRVRSMITDEDMKYILRYMTQ